VQTAFKEIDNELIANKTLNMQSKAQTALVQASKEAYDISNARYTQGVDSFLSVLSSHTFLFEAQLNAITLEKEKLENLVNLYKVLGGGLH
tara:strand:+ start:82 stop:354 length:273 start_codon:yes stop_codon:yes gene_type:complete